MSKLERTIAAMCRAGERTGLEADVAEHIARNWMMGAGELLYEMLEKIAREHLDDENVLIKGRARLQATADAMLAGPEDQLAEYERFIAHSKKMIKEGRLGLAENSLRLAEMLEDGR